MGEHHERNRCEGGFNRGHEEHERSRCHEESYGEREYCRPSFRPVPIIPLSGFIEMGGCFPRPEVIPPRVVMVEPQVMVQQQQCAPRGNYTHGWQRGGYEVYPAPLAQAPSFYQNDSVSGRPYGYQASRGNYMHGWQRGGYDVYQEPQAQAPIQYLNDSVSGGPFGYQANRQQYDSGIIPSQDSRMGTGSQVFSDVLRGFDAYAAYDIAKRHARR